MFVVLLWANSRVNLPSNCKYTKTSLRVLEKSIVDSISNYASNEFKSIKLHRAMERLAPIYKGHDEWAISLERGAAWITAGDIQWLNVKNCLY